MLKVLIALDGSRAARSAEDFAVALLAGKESSVLVLSVVPEHTVYGRGGAGPAESYDDLPALREATTQLLRESVQRLQGAGVGPSLDTRLVAGDPTDQILAAADDFRADLIVLGSRGLNATQRFLVGSVSTRVTTHATCAVLVVHPHAEK